MPSHSCKFIQYPDSDSIVDLKQRKAKIDDPLLKGAEVSIIDPEFGEVSAKVLLPNFKIISVLDLSSEIAHLMALAKLKNKKEA